MQIQSQSVSHDHIISDRRSCSILQTMRAWQLSCSDFRQRSSNQRPSRQMMRRQLAGCLRTSSWPRTVSCQMLSFCLFCLGLLLEPVWANLESKPHIIDWHWFSNSKFSECFRCVHLIFIDQWYHPISTSVLASIIASRTVTDLILSSNRMGVFLAQAQRIICGTWPSLGPSWLVKPCDRIRNMFVYQFIRLSVVYWVYSYWQLKFIIAIYY